MNNKIYHLYADEEKLKEWKKYKINARCPLELGVKRKTLTSDII